MISPRQAWLLICILVCSLDTGMARRPKSDPELAQQAYELYAKKDWAALETLFTEQGLNESWLPNRSFIDRKPGVMEIGRSSSFR